MDWREEIESIYKQNGRITPQMVVDIARPPDHPLHGRYEWDDRVAGESWRRHQAQEDIRAVRIRYLNAQGEPEHTRAFVSVPDAEGFAYRHIDDVAKDPVLSEIALRDAERAWRDLFKRYGHLREFVDIVRGSLGEVAA